jgi:isoquinoline 1-oxidoreductase beta subunit
MADTGSFELAPSRRMFLQVVGLGAAGFAVGCGPQVKTPAGPAVLHVLGPFVKIGSDDTVTVLIKHIEFGQGTGTGLSTIIAEELDARWDQVRFEHAPAEVPTYGNIFFGGVVQATGGSTAIANSWEQHRMAGAAARAMLVQAAAAQWGVAAETITVEKGVVRANGKKATFGQLAEAAGKIAPPAPESLTLKDPSKFTLIGKELAGGGANRPDSVAKTNGTAQYAMDYRPEGALTALIARAPRFGGKVKSFDAAAAKAVPGVVDVVQIPNGVAVLANDFWAAKKGRDALVIAWDDSKAEKRSTDQIMAEFRRIANRPGAVVRKDAAGAAAIGRGGQTLTAEFTFPYLAHAPMETLNCVLAYTPGQSCEIWSGAQIPTIDQGAAARILELEAGQVKINSMLAGGSFGRRATPEGDLVSEAASVAKAIQGRAPVKLVWTREDDIKGGKYRPLTVHKLSATLIDGKVAAWHNRIVSQAILLGTAFVTPELKTDPATAEGAATFPYEIPNMQVEVVNPQVGVPVLWWRSVGHTHTAYATEIFLDECARALGKDPVALRREMLANHPRHLGVLNLAAEKAGWGQPLPAGKFRGVAVHESFNSFVAEIAEITLNADRTFSVDRVVCAVDCGIAINPDQVRAQMEGGIGYGLSAVLGEAITMKDGIVQNANFPDYPVLRFDQMPKIEVHIVPSTEKPTGVGEPGTPPIGPAVANALLAATGKAIRALPIGDKV